MSKPINDSGEICPLHNKDVKKVCHTCPWYQKISGKHPQRDEYIDEWACAIAWMPFLTIENSQQQRQTGAAIESFRNAVVKSNQETVRRVEAQIQRKQLNETENQ